MTPVEEWDEEGPFQLGLRDGAGDTGSGEHPHSPGVFESPFQGTVVPACAPSLVCLSLYT